MNRLPSFRCLILLLGIWANPIQAAAGSSEEPAPGSIFDREPLEKAPESRILDKARLFSESEHASLSAKLTRFANHHGADIFVVAYSVLIGESIEERASRLKKQWLGSEPGLVLAYERGSEMITFSANADPLRYVSESALKEMFSSAYQRASLQSNASARVIAASEEVMEKLPTAIELQRSTNAETISETRSFIRWALPGLLTLTVVGMVMFYRLRKIQVKKTESYRFPPLETLERYGGGYSSGHHAEIRFRVRSE